MSSTAIITGANRGLGLELVKKFSDEGWHVIAACREIKKFPDKYRKENISVWQLDLADQKSVDEFVLKCKEKLKSVDVLINNAGVFNNAYNHGPIFTEYKDIIPVFVINSVGPYYLTNALVSLMSASKTKVVITVSSDMGQHSKMDDYNAKHWIYSGSKAATNFAMDGFAYNHSDITSVLIDPGWMKTRLGGDDAPIKPSYSAQKIYEMSQSKNKLKNGRLYDIEGHLQEW